MKGIFLAGLAGLAMVVSFAASPFTFRATGTGAAPGNELLRSRWGYYRADEASGDLVDEAPSANDLALIGSCASVAGALNTARVVTAGNGFFIQDGNEARTAGVAEAVTVWVKLATLTGSQTIVSEWDETHDLRLWRLYFNDQATDQWSLDVCDDGTAGGVRTISLTPGAAITTGVWYFLCWRSDGSTTVTLFAAPASGALQSTTGTPGAEAPLSGNLLLDDFTVGGQMGATSGTIQASQRLNGGDVDEIGVWRNLTDAKVTALFNGGTPPDYSTFTN